MASKTLRIATVDRATYIDLLSSTIYIRTDTWQTAPEPESGILTETFDLVFTGTDSTIRSNVETLSKMVQRVMDYNDDPFSATSIWWEENSDSESTTMKRSLILDLAFAPNAEGPYTKLLGKTALFVTVAVVHRDIYEDSNTVTDDSPLGGKGIGFPTLKSSVVGTAPGRVARMLFVSNSASYTFDQLWMGWRNTYGETAANFTPVQEAEAGTATLGAHINDANASPGGGGNNTWQVTTVPTNLNTAPDWDGTLDATTRSAATGKYLVLGRIKVNTGTVGIELSYGPDCNTSAPKSIYRNEMVYASATFYKIIELGYFQYPFFGRGVAALDYGVSSGDYGRMAIRLLQISGTTTDFRLDCLTLIPADRLLRASNCTIGQDVAGSFTTVFIQTEDEQPKGVNYTIGLGYVPRPTGSPEALFTNWGWPWDGGIMVIACQNAASGSAYTDEFRVYLRQRARYRAYIV